MEDARRNVKQPEAVDVVKCDGKEGLHMIFIREELMDVEELVPRPTKESHCLLRPSILAEVNPCPKARGGEQHVPPGFTDVRHGDQGFVHGKHRMVPFRFGEKKGDENEDLFG